MQATNNITAQQIISAIKNAETVLVCGHIRPDGDCIGSVLAMRKLCVKLGAKCDGVCDCDKPAHYAFLPDYEKYCVTTCKNYDLFIALDSGDEKRLGKYAKYLSSCKNSINIDHHPSNDRYAKYNLVDETASSVCQILYELFCDSGLIDLDTAQLLYVGLSTDTGNFMHSNTNAKVFSVAAALCAFGIDVATINHNLYRNNTMNKTLLTAKAIENIKLFCDGKIALMTIMRDDLKKCGCDDTDTEGLIDYASSITGVRISICMCEQDGLFRVSFRSTGADVSAVAALFGGGGHKVASGCVITGDAEDVGRKVVNAAAKALK